MVSILLRNNNHADFVLAIINDITKTKQAEQMLKNNGKRKGIKQIKNQFYLLFYPEQIQ